MPVNPAGCRTWGQNHAVPVTLLRANIEIKAVDYRIKAVFVRLLDMHEYI
jgi:hypothetical protein